MPHSSHKRLISIAKQIKRNDRLTPSEINTLLTFKHVEEESKFQWFLSNAAFPLAIILGALMAMNESFFDKLFSGFPSWTFLSPQLETGLDYVWSIIGSPVEKNSFFYHIPNIIMYGAGLISIKGLIDAVHRKNWLDIVLDAQHELKERIAEGVVNYDLKEGHSILFIGKGDFIAQQFTEDKDPRECITLAETKPAYTNIWQYYTTESHENNLSNALDHAEAKYAGEYIFFPVQDIHIFLPSPTAYDMPPHRIDLHCRYIRDTEIKKRWAHNPIFIVGDRFQQSTVHTEDKLKKIEGSEDIISIDSIGKNYKDVHVIDPTEIVLERILKMAKERKIVFRATATGLTEYKDRFYERLDKLGYKKHPKEKGLFIVGYDIYEDQIEQQKLCGKLDDYYPVVLSKNVYEALVGNGLTDNDMIYVPDLVIEQLNTLAARQ